MLQSAIESYEAVHASEVAELRKLSEELKDLQTKRDTLNGWHPESERDLSRAKKDVEEAAKYHTAASDFDTFATILQAGPRAMEGLRKNFPGLDAWVMELWWET